MPLTNLLAMNPAYNRVADDPVLEPPRCVSREGATRSHLRDSLGIELDKCKQPALLNSP